MSNVCWVCNVNLANRLFRDNWGGTSLLPCVQAGNRYGVLNKLHSQQLYLNTSIISYKCTDKMYWDYVDASLAKRGIFNV